MRKRLVVACGVLAGALAAMAALAAGQQTSAGGARSAQTPQPLTVVPIRGPVYMVKGGSGANTGFIVGAKEVTCIDAKMTRESAEQMLAEIRKLTPKPIGDVILTHSDGDHINGLAGFPKGLTIIASEGTRKEMAQQAETDAGAFLRDYLPTMTFTKTLTRNLGGKERLELTFLGPAHTSGDTIVYLPSEKVAFVGDVIFLGRAPLIHAQKGGSVLGVVRYLDALLAMDVDIVLHGHGDPATKDDIRTLRKSYEDTIAQVRGLIAQGKSLDEVKAAMGVKEQPAQPGRPPRPGVVEILFTELSTKK